MARSKNLHYIHVEVDVIQPDDAGNIADIQIDMALELSKKLGRTIRQGNSFRLVGYGASLRSVSGQEFDIGFGVNNTLQYLPTQHYACKAWNNVFKAWKSQKQLKNAVGTQIRYDDMEFAWSSSHINSRTSTIQAKPLDTIGQDESLTLTGSSSYGLNYSLYDYAQSTFQIPEPSHNPFTDAVIKEPKFDSYFPEIETLYASANFSGMVDVEADPDTYGGGNATSPMTWLPSDNHVSIFCGLMRVFSKGTPIIQGLATADDLKLTITLAIEGWNSIVSSPRSKRSYKGRKSYGRKKTTKRRYYRRK